MDINIKLYDFGTGIKKSKENSNLSILFWPQQTFAGAELCDRIDGMRLGINAVLAGHPNAQVVLQHIRTFSKDLTWLLTAMPTALF